MNHRIAMITAERSDKDERIYRREAKTLAQAGWRVEIINPIFEGKDSSQIRFSRMALPENSVLRFFAAQSCVINAVRESRADICVLHDISLLPVVKSLKAFSVQTVADVHESEAKGSLLYSLPQGVSKRIYHSLLRRYLPLTQGVITANSLIAKRLEKINPNIAVVCDGPTCYDKALFECARQEKKTTGLPKLLASDLSLTEIFRLGRAAKQAGVVLLVTGKLPDKAKETLSRHGLSDCVRLLGVLSRREELTMLARSQAGIVTKYDENAARLYRFLAFNIPVVCLKRVMEGEHELSGPVFYPDDDSIEETASAIKSAVFACNEEDSSELWQRFGFEGEAERLLEFFAVLEKRAGELY